MPSRKMPLVPHHEENDVRIALAEMATRQDSVDTDLQEVRQAVVNLGKRIDDMGASINAKIDQRSQPQWQTYIGVAALLGGLFFAFIGPLKEKDGDLDREIGKVQIKQDNFEKDVNTTLKERNSLFVSQPEHKEYRLRVDDKFADMRGRLFVLEQMRPTTGELKGLVENSKDLANKLDERVRSLENFVRQPAKVNTPP